MSSSKLKARKLQDRLAKLECDEQRIDGSSIRDTDVSVWVNSPVSWGYQTLLDRATKRFKEFIKIMGPKDSRSKSYCSGLCVYHIIRCIYSA